MTFSLSNKSLARLRGVKPELVAVVELAIQLTTVDFCVVEGLRTLEKQAEYVKSGASKTMNSRHLDGHAVDLGAVVGDELRWDWPLYHELAEAMKAAAKELEIPLEWGGDWKTFPDGPHFQLPFKDFP